ncbi:two-component system sensor histidine kinase YesM [Evansella vedderi]|uniref:Two-component system sensor histidine kinase YesM n=1 Tax=Evansella vedderi TaxID=38282 RepID=A0ABT9ZR42_9BACI|nr:sensor histidine kinase [Evansella vedderi]MDQ0253197.1 two-component system sensor histidine kinase YesM [Evansella vedderi]
MNVFKKYKIKHIFFGAFSIFMTVVFLVITLVTYHISANEMVKTTTEYQQRSLQLLSADLNSRLKSIEDYSIVLARQQNFREVIRGNVEHSQQQSLTNDFSNIVYSVPALHSIEVYTWYPPLDNINYPVRYNILSMVREKEWFPNLDSVLYEWIGERKVDTIAGEQTVISYGRIINTTRGNLQAILILNLDPVILQGWLFQYSTSADLVLLDSEGIILSSTGSQEIGDDYYQDILELVRNNETNNYVEDEGDLIVASTLPTNDWVVMEITPYEDIIEGSRLMAVTLIIIGLIAFMFALIVNYLLTKRFTDPILQLVHAMKNYRLNDKKDTLPSDYKNEFGQLFKGYRDLITRSESLHNSLMEQSKRKREAEIKALQANINPHFLYNTLDQLNWSAIEHGYQDMSHMLELLGKMLRIGLSKGESIITLGDEIKYLHYYLQLQKIEKGEFFEYEIDVPEHLLIFYIPKLTFQPFVENSIIHGFRGRRKGKVQLKVRDEKEHLLIEINDNGVGFQSLTKNSSQDTGGYGITNVIERFNAYFGNHASINITNREEGGTAVLLRIPKVLDRENIEKYTD